MYKVVIAEDENIIRKGLMYSVPWSELDCIVVAECENGQEGVEAIRKHKPDIVLTDVCMPIMDGLEMIHQTYEEEEYSAIILSGYSDFEYAQSAIRYGVLRYLLKPLKKEEIRDAIAHAIRECEKHRYYQSHSKSRHEMQAQFLEENGQNYTGSDMLVHQMLEFVRENYERKLSMSDLVQKLNYSDTFLNKKFKEAMGTTFMEYVNRYRIRIALELMMDRHMQLQDVAWKCGIGEYKYFSTVFKKYMGCSPKKYLETVE